MLAAALGVYWIAAPREACPEELYRQYMELSPFEQFDQKEKLLKKAAQAGCVPAMRQMADHNFISKNDLKVDEYNYWIKKAADHGSPQAQYEAFTECISENPSEVLAYPPWNWDGCMPAETKNTASCGMNGKPWSFTKKQPR
mgnify:CR=1 FL=1